MTQPQDRHQTGGAEAGEAAPLSDDQVIDFLRESPDFLVRNPDIFDDMEAPARWSGDGVVDMQHYLISRNRTEMDELRDCAQDVIETSRSNMSTQTRSHAAVLSLMVAREWGDIVHVVSHDWPLLLDVDVVAMAFEPPDRPSPLLAGSDIGKLAAGSVDLLIGDDQDARLLREAQDDGTLFGSGAGLVKSAALMRMRPGAGLPPGILALGARSVTFHPGQGTELLGFLCRVLESCIARSFEAPEGSAG